VRRILIKRFLKVKPDVHFGCVLLNTEKINVFVMKLNVLVSAFISYSILMLVKYSVFCFKLSVILVAYDIKMNKEAVHPRVVCSPYLSVTRESRLPWCLSLPTPVAQSRLQLRARSPKERMCEDELSDSDVFTQAV
jgi:hypothetical protein